MFFKKIISFLTKHAEQKNTIRPTLEDFKQIGFIDLKSTPKQKLDWLDEMHVKFRNYLPDRSKVEG